MNIHAHKDLNLGREMASRLVDIRSPRLPAGSYLYHVISLRSGLLLPLLLAALAGPVPHCRAQFYQGSNVEFGKNRVQYKDFEWFYYPGPHFEVYYYIGGEQLAQYALMSCERNLEEMQKWYDFALEDKIQALVYTKQSEFRQSNVGITGDDQFNIGGAARILGNKMFLYYEGDHARLERQVREGISRMIFSQMMYGGDWKDVLKSSTLLSVPKWYEEGIIRFSAAGHTEEAEMYMRDQVVAGRFRSLNRLYDREAALGGAAFWHYISEVYGEAVIPNILYMARVSRNVESGFLFVLGMPLETVTREFARYYREKYSGYRQPLLPGESAEPAGDPEALRAWRKSLRHLGELPVRYRKKYRYSQFCLSPDGKHMAYVTHELGQYKIWIYSLEERRNRRILRREPRLERIPDESFPVLGWHPSGEVLTYVTERRGRAFIGNYNLSERKHSEKELFRIEKVVSMDYSPDGKKIIFSGVNRGQTDLYLYQVIGNNQEQLTFDVYDDLQPRFLQNGRSVIFASNRPDDTLRKDVPVDRYPLNKDIFLFSLDNRSALLDRITETPDLDEHDPSGYSAGHYTYLRSYNGVDNRFLSRIDSAISRIDTTIHYRYFTVSEVLSGFPRSPVSYLFDEASGAYTSVFMRGMRPLVHTGQRGDDHLRVPEGAGPAGPSPSGVMPERGVLFEAFPDTGAVEIDIRNYVFEDERKDYAYEKESVKLQEVGSAAVPADTAKPRPFELPRSRNYRLNFATDYVLTQVDNSFTSAFYQNFTGPTSINPGISGLIKLGISDLFEDYKVVGGFRLSGDLQNNDYGLSFENLRKRWDRRLSFMRQSQFQADQFTFFRVHTHSFTYQLRYPFNELSSLRFTGILRHDRIVQLSVDPVSLSEPNANEYNAGLRVEYVFDNTIGRGLNLYNGTRFKLWLERYQQPDRWEERTDFNVIGGDFRHYLRIHRELIAAFRAAGATTLGANRLVHYLGGVDNWLFQRVDNSMPIATDQSYRFQSFAGPMRGFYVNARNGNSFLLANSEIRWPVFKYFLNKPIKSDFVENFQIVGFLDAGTAWTGRSPYSRDNSFNQTVVEQNPITVIVENNREPVIYGYGFGLRSRVLGYFMRADWAWGVDDGIVLPRVFYLSLNLDF